MTSKPGGLWVLERCGDERFPYRLQIAWGEGFLLILRTQERWPISGGHIFCLKEKTPPSPGEVLSEIERVPVVALQQRGPRLSVVLDRKRYRRCDFLFVSKSYKSDPEKSYEQIFWQTQKSLQQRRPAFKLSLPLARPGMAVRIDHRERYPWRFPGASAERGELPAGDYAIVKDDEILATVERKTLDNLLSDFGAMPVLHQRLSELAAYRHHALVIEAPYHDFLSPKKVHHYTPGFCARAIAELAALHPHLHMVFCANRKAANEWARHYFAAVWGLAMGLHLPYSGNMSDNADPSPRHIAPSHLPRLPKRRVP